MNELLYKQIVGDEVNNLQTMISKGYIETSDFKAQISVLATLFGFLSQAMED